MVGLRLTDGSLTAECPAYRPGDVSGDCSVNSADVYTVLWFAVHPDQTPSANQLSAGDINQSGNLDAGDAAPILYYIVNGRWPQGSTRGGHVSDSAPITLSINSVSGAPDAVVRATLSAEDLSGWAAGEFVITYDLSLVSGIDAVYTTPLSSGFLVDHTAESELRIAMADGAEHAGDGAVLTFDIHIAPDAPNGATTNLVLSEARLYDIHGDELERTILRENGLLQVTEYKIYLPQVMKQNP